MSKKIDKFVVPDDIIRKMNEKIKESRSKKVEVGFALCTEKNKNVLKAGEQFLGGPHGEFSMIKVPAKRCKDKDQYRGIFHTHVDGMLRPSISDMYHMYEYGLGCIGTTIDNKIKCYVRKGPKTEKADQDIRMALIWFEYTPLWTDEQKDKEAKRLTRKYFNEIDLK
jgi:hypothetical protein